MSQLGEHFVSDDRSRHSEWLQHQQWFIKARRDHERKEEAADNLQDDILALAAEVILATEIQIEEFKVKLDAYDEATVIALMENQELLDAVNAQLHSMLERAYVMDDGRRVFKTEDGTQVFDEFANEVKRDELDFDLISPGSPTWEQRLELLGKRDQLTSEREQILEFQEKLDHAREQVVDSKISISELDDLDAELADAMPPSVKAHLSESAAAAKAPNIKSAFTVHTGQIVAKNLVVNLKSTITYDPI